MTDTASSLVSVLPQPTGEGSARSAEVIRNTAEKRPKAEIRKYKTHRNHHEYCGDRTAERPIHERDQLVVDHGRDEIRTAASQHRRRNVTSHRHRKCQRRAGNNALFRRRPRHR